jgi:hypothetical protein
MTADDIAHAAPFSEVPGYAGVELLLYGTPLERIQLAAADGPALGRALEKQWGPPRASPRPDATPRVWFWFAEPKRIRAVYDGATVDLQHYIPIDEMVGAAGATFGFESLPILGTDVAELEAHYASFRPSHGINALWLHLPPTDYELWNTQVNIDLDSTGHATAVSFVVSYLDREGYREELIHILERRWGQATREHDDTLDEEVLVFRKNPRLTVEKELAGQAWRITRER